MDFCSISKFFIIQAEQSYRLSIILFLVWFFAPGGAAIAQVMYLPPAWAQWQQVLPMINPANNGASAGVDVIIGNQRFLGLWSNNQVYFANAAVRIHNGKREKSFHVAGGQWLTDKEGAYLLRTKLYAQYAFHLQLGGRLWMAAGTAIGAMSYTVGSNDFNNGGASTAPDASVGIWIYNKSDYFIGISGHQLFESKLMPIREVTRLVRYYNITAGKDITISPDVTLRPAALLRLAPGFTSSVAAGLNVVLVEKVLTGINLAINRDIAFTFGLQDIEWGNANLRGIFSYRLPVGSYAPSNQQSFEITLGVGFTKNKQNTVENEENE